MMFRVNPEIYRSIVEHIEKGRKISAIKALRCETKAGLKEAKEAIERMQHEKNIGHYPTAAERAKKIHCGPLIKRVILDYGTGELEVDLETMELKALMDMQAIGLEACGEVLELVKILQAFGVGRKVEVLDETR